LTPKWLFYSYHWSLFTLAIQRSNNHHDSRQSRRYQVAIDEAMTAESAGVFLLAIEWQNVGRLVVKITDQ